MRFFVSSSAVALVLSVCMLSSRAELPEEWPAFRYVAHDSLLVDNRDCTESLTYTEDSWNVPGTLLDSQGIEFLSFESLQDTQQLNAYALGFDEDTWDCYQNHFADYDWAEIVRWDLDGYFGDLGWTEEIWENTTGTMSLPATDDMDYSELSLKEKLAAEGICYFQANWDMEELSDYPEDAPSVPSGAFGPAVTTTMFIVGAAFAAMVL